MNALNSIFVVLLVILIGFGAIGYLYNEYQDLRQECTALRQANTTLDQDIGVLSQDNEHLRRVIVDKDAQIGELGASIKNQDEQHQIELQEKDRQLGEAQVVLDQCHAEKEIAQQSLATCNGQAQQTHLTLIQSKADLNACRDAWTSIGTQTEPSNQDELSTQRQVQTPQLAAVAPEAIVLLATGIGGVAIIIGLIFRTRVHKLQDVPSPVQFSAAPRTNPKQVTVKMNHQAYQGYLNYLKSAKK